MKNIKKIISALLALFLMSAPALLTGCGRQTAGDEGRWSIVTTIFPEYDWVKNLLGEKADRATLTMLLDSGVDLHSYQPTVEDLVKIANCDLFLYVGGESDGWVEDALKNTADRNKDRKVLNLLEILGDQVKNEEPIEGAEEEGDPASSGNEEDHGHEHEDEKDEHVWLSLRNARICCEAIAEQLSAMDSENQKVYAENLRTYTEKLSALDRKYSEAVRTGSRKTLLFGDRFPFRYLTEDYGLEYYAAFSGCSAETEASFATVTFLAGKVDELNLPCVLTIQGSTHKIAQTVVNNTTTKDQKILLMDSMQSTTWEDVKNGASYLSIMEKNLEALKTALQ